jgi:hypothetical protein
MHPFMGIVESDGSTRGEAMNGIVEQEKELKLFPITEGMTAEISRYRGEIRVDIRKWYHDPKSGYARSKNGLNVTLEEWEKLLAAIGEINAFVQQNLREM